MNRSGKNMLLDQFKNKLFYFTLFFLLSFCAHAKSEYENLLNEDGSLRSVFIKENPERYLSDQSIIYQRNEDTGVIDKVHYTGHDKGRLTFKLMANINIVKLMDLLAFEIEYAKNLGPFWVETFLSYVSAKFDAISENRSGFSFNSHAESNNIRTESTGETLLSYGLGAGYRFKFPDALNLWEIKDLFQTTSLFGTYNLFSEAYVGETYAGLGARAEYGIHKRVSIDIQYGIKFSYNVAEVMRGEAIENEHKNDRRLFLSWLSIAFDVSYYY